MLAAAGWHVIAHGRDPVRCAAAEAAIRAAASPRALVNFIRADLSLMVAADEIASQVHRLTDRLEVLSRRRRVSGEKARP
jgi:NAD(P)-dependent dehydrogenase (short-subunit alcohol dehydrogenase family)